MCRWRRRLRHRRPRRPVRLPALADIEPFLVEEVARRGDSHGTSDRPAARVRVSGTGRKLMWCGHVDADPVGLVGDLEHSVVDETAGVDMARVVRRDDGIATRGNRLARNVNRRQAAIVGDRSASISGDRPARRVSLGVKVAPEVIGCANDDAGSERHTDTDSSFCGSPDTSRLNSSEVEPTWVRLPERRSVPLTDDGAAFGSVPAGQGLPASRSDDWRDSREGRLATSATTILAAGSGAISTARSGVATAAMSNNTAPPRFSARERRARSDAHSRRRLK